jgi:hypothetical protein
MYDDDSAGMFLLKMALFGGAWFFGYQKGKADTIHEVRHICMEHEMEELRAKLAEQNRINEMNRKFV